MLSALEKTVFALFSSALLLGASASVAIAAGKGSTVLCNGGYLVVDGTAICTTYVATQLPGGGGDLVTLPVCDRLTRARVTEMALSLCRPVSDPKRCDKFIIYRGIKTIDSEFNVGPVRVTCPVKPTTN